MDLSIIIINWNSKGYLRECLKSIPQAATGLECEVLVIDNASYDGAAQMLAQEFSHVTFIQSDRNLGFSAANNRAARQAKGDFLLFLNPDTIVMGKSLGTLVDALRKLPHAGAVGAKLLNTDRTLQTSCVQSFPTVLNQMLDCEMLRRRFPRSTLWGMAALFDGSHQPAPVEAISGACFMVKRHVFDRLGGFDERYFMYSEDIDLAYRIHREGFNCYYVPEATVIHHGGGSSKSAGNGFSATMMRESIFRFMQFRKGRSAAVLFRVVILFSALVRMGFILLSLPFHLLRFPHCRSAMRKWLAILKWSVGGEQWAGLAPERESL